MGRIVVLDNPLAPSATREYSHTGPYIDFLLKHFPTGFPGAHVTSLNLTRLAVDDYDTVIGDNDTVVLGIAPGLEWALIGTAIYQALIGAVIAIALNYAINALFGPDGSKPVDPVLTNEASSTYSLNTPTNVARIGQPIPVAYGRNLIVPDLASSPYRFFAGNNEYVVLMFCLGMGEYEVHDILVGDVSVYTLGDDIIGNPGIWGPWDHQQTFGLIQGRYGWASGFRENVYTSPEVSDQELFAGTVGGDPSAYSTYIGTGILTNAPVAASFTLDAPASYWSTTSGRPVYLKISDSPGNDGVYLVSYLGYGADGMSITFGWISDPAWAVPGVTATIQLSYTEDFSESSYGWGTPVGPFNCGGREVLTDVIWCDIDFPGGCYTVNQETGEMIVLGVDLMFISEAIDDDDNVLYQSGSFYFHEEFATRTQQRRSIEWEVPYGRHRVTAWRMSPKSNLAGSQSDVYWVGLKSVLGNPFLTATNNLTYEHTTLVTVIARASEGIASDALTRFSVDCTRKLEMPDGSRLVTRDPISAFEDAFTNWRYGGARPSTELDTARLDELSLTWSDRLFDAVFDQPSTLWEVLGLILQTQHAAPSILGSVVTIVEDKNHSVGTFALTEDAITSLTLTYLFSDGEDPDGVECKYRDPDDNSALYAIWPEASTNPESVTLWGCRDYDTALAYAKQRWAQLVYRRRLVTLETELEGHVISVGEAITVQHPLLGTDPVLCVVQAVNPKEEFAITLDLHIHQPEVFAT